MGRDGGSQDLNPVGEFALSPCQVLPVASVTTVTISGAPFAFGLLALLLEDTGGGSAGVRRKH